LFITVCVWLILFAPSYKAVSDKEMRTLDASPSIIV
jgi:hypothetical protein